MSEPRYMKTTTAARYMDMCLNTFRDTVAPLLTAHPVPGTNQKRYDRQELDRLMAGGITDPHEQRLLDKARRTCARA